MNFFYHESGIKLPKEVALIPVHGSILMPNAQLKIPISEDYLIKILSAATNEDLYIGLVQPMLDKFTLFNDKLPVFSAGTLGRITEVSEIEENSILANIVGICRFDIENEYEREDQSRFATANYERYLQDLNKTKEIKINRKKLIKVLDNYFRNHDVSPNWKEIDKTTDENLITVLSMLCPFNAREKQALLEANSVEKQTEMITKFIEFSKFDGISPSTLRH